MLVFVCFVEKKDEVDEICENLEEKDEKWKSEVGKTPVLFVRHYNVGYNCESANGGFGSHVFFWPDFFTINTSSNSRA